jgi:pentatricopeptide repeat protein
MRPSACSSSLRLARRRLCASTTARAFPLRQVSWVARPKAIPSLNDEVAPIDELRYIAETAPLVTTSEKTGFGPSAAKVKRYNTAYKALQQGLSLVPSGNRPPNVDKLALAWDLAIEQGFRVIDDLKLGRDLTDRTLGQLLELTTLCEEASATRDAAGNLEEQLGPTRANWIIATAGSMWDITKRIAAACARASLRRNSTLDKIVGRWAWIQVGRGQRGAEQVLEIFDEVGGNWEWYFEPDSEGKVMLMAPGLYSAVVASLAVLPNVPPLSTVLTSLTPRVYCVANLGEFSEAASLINFTPASRQRIYHWVRQANLALLWQNSVSHGDETLLWVARTRKLADRNMGDKLLVTWKNMVEGSEGKEAWIKTSWKDTTVEIPDELPEPTELPPPQGKSSKPFQPTLNPAIVAGFLEGFVRLRLPGAATSLWDTLIKRGLKPTRQIWQAVLRGHSSTGSIKDIEDTFARMRHAGFAPNAEAWAAVVLSYLRGGDVPGGLVRLQAMKRELKHPWPIKVNNELMNNLLKANQPVAAKEIFDECVKHGVFSIVSANAFLRYYSMPDHLSTEHLSWFLRFITEKNLEPDSATFTILLDGLLRADVPDAFDKVWEMMGGSGVKASVVTYATMMNYLCQRQGESGILTSLQMLNRMEREGIRTNEVVYTTLIQALCRMVESGLASVEQSTELLGLAGGEGPVQVSFTRGGGSRASRLQERSEGFVHPYLEAAVKLRQRMQNRNIPLNTIGFNSLISAYLSLGDPRATDVALDILRELRERNRRVRSAGKTSGGGGGQRPEGGAVAERTWYIMLRGLMGAGEIEKARVVVKMMEMDGFVVQSGMMARIVDAVKRGIVMDPHHLARNERPRRF